MKKSIRMIKKEYKYLEKLKSQNILLCFYIYCNSNYNKFIYSFQEFLKYVGNYILELNILLFDSNLGELIKFIELLDNAYFIVFEKQIV